MRFLLLIALFMSSFSSAVHAQQPPPEGNPMREFLMSCTYGVMAGTLVGAASLAFTDKPSENLKKVARGASLGLYTGILLGLYVVYIVPSLDAPEEEEDPVALAQRMPILISPTFNQNDVPDGAKVDWNVMSF